jgi:hypothetical protein
MPRIRVLLPALAALLALGSTQSAFACGAMLSADGNGADLAGMTSMLAYDGSREDLTVGVDYGRTAGDFAWLMPLPTTPSVSTGEFAGIARALDLTQPPSAPDYGVVRQSTPGSDEMGRAAVGNLQLVTLGAPGGPSIEAWMKTNGFAFHDRQGIVVKSYLDRGWVFVAARIHAQTPLAGRFTPIRFQFSSTEAVYPLAIAGADHSGTLPMRLFILTPYRPTSVNYQEGVVRPDQNGNFPPAGPTLELRYSAPLSATDQGAMRQTAAVSPDAWLTEYVATWNLSGLNADLVFDRGASQARIDNTALRARFDAQAAVWQRNYNLVMYSLTAGAIAIPIGLLVFLVLTAVLLGRQRQRRSIQPIR